jgi:PTH2 family peptidyl-tRNA hydrolase
MSKKKERENTNDEYVMYIIINNEVKMSKGKVASQACHSACHVTRILERQRNKEPGYNRWLKDGEPKIVLKATEKDMLNIINQYEVDNRVKRTSSGSIWCVHTRDFGRTEVAPDTLTSIAFKPVVKVSAPREITKLRLL